MCKSILSFAPRSIYTFMRFLNDAFSPQGQAFVNKLNAGRYWPSMGPQETLFIPKSALSREQDGNVIVLFEIDGPAKDSEMFVQFINKPVWKKFPQ